MAAKGLTERNFARTDLQKHHQKDVFWLSEFLEVSEVGHLIVHRNLFSDSNHQLRHCASILKTVRPSDSSENDNLRVSNGVEGFVERDTGFSDELAL